MSDVVTILFSERPEPERVNALQAELVELAEVTSAGSTTTRSLGVADLALWVGLAADAVGVAAIAAATLEKIIERVRGKRIRGAVIELPNGAKISVDAASSDELLSLVSAWRLEDIDWSGRPAEGS